jgi:signal transduction histidine kinase
MKQEPIVTRPARILVVDDEPRNRELLQVMLTPEGFEILTAASGEEALAIVAAHQPDLILLDVMMPGLNGYEVAGQIKRGSDTKNILVIMVTALDDRNARLLGLGAGAEDFLTKPVDRAELCVRVKNLLRLKAYGDYYDQYSQMLEGQEEIRMKQARFKDEFLSHVSHELRSPLTAIKQFTTILLGGVAGELNNQQADYQRIVLRNIVQLQSMIDDLLEVTQLENGKLAIEQEAVFVSDAVTDACHTLERTALDKGVALSFEVAPDLPPAHADPIRLRQILIILLDNALKFTPKDGAVRVQARLHPDDHRALLIAVADTGCGIAPEATERIFERLHQESAANAAGRRGLGLGLYICKELVVRQGGDIWVDSFVQEGSTFSFTVPRFSDLDAPHETGPRVASPLEVGHQ